MKVSIVVTTYNWKEALEVSVLSMLNQTVLPDEIVIADDGSKPDTKVLIDRLKDKSPVPIKHVWQEDNGFRVSKIRNKAIAKAAGEYIIHLDGDMVLERHFVEDHKNFAKSGYFTQGGRVMTKPELKEKILKTKKFDSIHFFSQGVGNRKNTVRSEWLSSVTSGDFEGLKAIRTCNMAFWKKDIELANGFNEAFEGWGREDSEFVVRLFNNGIKRQNLKHRAIAYHLYHPESSRKMLEANEKVLADTINKKSKFCDLGINQYSS